MSKQVNFARDICSGTITFLNRKDILVNGKLNTLLPNGTLYYWAAAPPTSGLSFSGSGMPYPSPLIAYDRTPNKGVINIENGEFSFNIKYPNAYYIGLGSLYIAPHINFKISIAGQPDNYFSVQIDDGIPFRMLTYPAPPSKKPRISPLFYCEPEKPARTQEEIFRSSGYTDFMPDNFWGNKPPR